MSPRIKVAGGMLLLLPAMFVLLAALVFRFEHPEMTETEIDNDTGNLPYVALMAAVPGVLLVRSGLDEKEAE